MACVIKVTCGKTNDYDYDDAPNAGDEHRVPYPSTCPYLLARLVDCTVVAFSTEDARNRLALRVNVAPVRGRPFCARAHSKAISDLNNTCCAPTGLRHICLAPQRRLVMESGHAVVQVQAQEGLSFPQHLIAHLSQFLVPHGVAPCLGGFQGRSHWFGQPGIRGQPGFGLPRLPQVTYLPSDIRLSRSSMLWDRGERTEIHMARVIEVTLRQDKRLRLRLRRRPQRRR